MPYGNIATATQGMPAYVGYQPPGGAVNQPVASSGGANAPAAGAFDSILSGALGTAAGIYGSQNATEAQTQGSRNAIGTQNTTLGNINSIFAPQTALGTGAMDALGRALGTGGQPPDYSGFYSSPAFRFGAGAVDRQAAAGGNLYSTSTLGNLNAYAGGEYFNNYIQQLMGAAGLGAQANAARAGLTYSTGANISQLQQNIGTANAGGYSNTGAFLRNFLGGSNASGVGSTVGNWLTKAGNYIGNAFSGGPNTSGANTGDMTNGAYNGGAFGGGAPYYDPSTGGYPGTDTGSAYGSNIPTDANGNPVWDLGGGGGTDTGPGP